MTAPKTAPPEQVYCPGCNQTKPRAAFHVSLTRRDQVQAHCKRCRSDRRSDRVRMFANYDRGQVQAAELRAKGWLAKAHPEEYDRFMAKALAEMTEAPE